MLPTWNSCPFEPTMADDVVAIIGHYFPHNKAVQRDARAGIRIRVSGMKTHHDGPGYTTRAQTLGRAYS